MIYFRELVTFLSLLAWIEMATTVMNDNDRLRKGKLRLRHYKFVASVALLQLLENGTLLDKVNS